MLKILYAADNRSSSFYSLKRFIDVYSKFYDIRIAGYSKSLLDTTADWNLDALLDFKGKYNTIGFTNNNYHLYFKDVKEYKPDLIISDLELYTSYIGVQLGIPVWQVSSVLLHYGSDDHNADLYKYYSGLFSKNLTTKTYLNYILKHSSKKLVVSHLCDIIDAPILNTGYEWVRPNYTILDKSVVNPLSNAVNLADAFYNGQFTKPVVKFDDVESILVYKLNCDYGLSGSSDFQQQSNIKININYDVKFLSQYLKELDI